MVVHVGIDFYYGELLAYNTESTYITEYKISRICVGDGIEKAELIFGNFDIILNGELGCACICLPFGFSYEFRQQLVRCGLSHGFKKIQIIDRHAASFYAAALWKFNDIIPQNCDFIFIDFFNNDALIHLGQINSGIVTFGDVYVVRRRAFNNAAFENDVVKRLGKNYSPRIFCQEDFDIELVGQYFSHAICHTYKQYERRFGALLKARIMGKDLSINYFDVESKFGTSLILKVNNVEIMRVEFGQLLPLKKAVVYEWLKNDDILTVISVDGKKEQQLFSKNGKILIMLKVDKNKKFCTEISDNLRRQENKAANFHDISDIDYFPAKILINDNNIDAIGIDLGTTRCCVAVNRTNGIETIALDNLGERLLPSYVAFDEEKEKCGKIVIDRLRYHAKCSVFDVKRIIGKHYEEIKVDNSWPFVIQTLLVIESKSKNLPKSEDDIVLKLKTADKTLYKYPEEITSVLLKHIKTKAEEFQGKQLTETVITIPATFNEKQKQATYDAAVLAGWKTVYLLPEHVAAAFAYFIDRPIPSNSNFVLFDLGGGTLDVCVFKIKNNKLKIKSRSGDPDLGGRNFDNLLVKFFQEKLFLQYNVVIPEDKRFKLFLKCQNIKENLSSSMEQHFDAEEFDASINAFIPVSRDEFELMSIKILFQIRKAIEIALSKSNFMPTQIDKVLQVGGGCRMPMIKKLLKDVFHHAEICCETNPDEVVAIGAAYCAYYLNETDKTEYMYQEDESKCSIM